MKRNSPLRKLDKKECRKTGIPPLHIPLSQKLDCPPTTSVLLRSRIKRIGRRNVLLLCLYPVEGQLLLSTSPDRVLFQGMQDYTTLDFSLDAKGRFRSASIYYLDDRLYDLEKYAFFSPSDRERVLSFCRDFPEADPIRCLDSLQEKIRETGAYQKKLDEQKKIRKAMRVPALPKGIRQWAHKNILPTYLFYDSKRGQKSVRCRCSSCGKQSAFSKIRHNMPLVCPHCGRNATAKSRKRFKRLYDRTTLQVIQKLSPQKLLIRWMKITCLHFPHKRFVISCHESARGIMEVQAGRATVFSMYYNTYDGSGSASWRPGCRPTLFGKYTYESDLDGYLYTPILDDQLCGTPWQYSQLLPLYQAHPYPRFFPQYLYSYLKYPFLEYLVKLKLYRLASGYVFENSAFHADNILNISGQTAVHVLRVRRQDIPLLTALNPGLFQLKLAQAMIREYGRIHIPLMEWSGRHEIWRVENLLVPLKYMTPEALMKYTEKQCSEYRKKSTYYAGRYSAMNSVLDDYRDYLSMSEALKLDMTNSFILYPYDLKTAHDQQMDLSAPGQLELYNHAVASLHHELSPVYSFSRDDYMVRLPESAEEICQEGAALHHCVQRYIPDHVKRKCTLLFLRKTDAQEKPLCTLEIQGDRLMQAKCFGNNLPGPSIQKFLKKYEHEALHAAGGRLAA